MKNRTAKVTHNTLDYYLLMRTPYSVNTCTMKDLDNVWDLKKLYLIYMLYIKV